MCFSFCLIIEFLLSFFCFIFAQSNYNRKINRVFFSFNFQFLFSIQKFILILIKLILNLFFTHWNMFIHYNLIRSFSVLFFFCFSLNAKFLLIYLTHMHVRFWIWCRQKFVFCWRYLILKPKCFVTINLLERVKWAIFYHSNTFRHQMCVIFSEFFPFEAFFICKTRIINVSKYRLNISKKKCFYLSLILNIFFYL